MVFDDAPHSVEEALGSYALCPYEYDDDPAKLAATFGVCRCLKKGEGSLYGTGIYTADSDICAAGVHEGAIPETGGLVEVRQAPCQACSKAGHSG